ncbi:hypothetical protein DL89DRAFT_265543 [Linderina pennispora]|uniref:Uncharacterized protein n=1 Tax=Linderina pennispora TaxID=61395 RepID=A0A1Y1WE76_9FUNG|nr:uncharacterized protein DL89DRAFT_265543 [Linderina pennispora]ORX71831.1 hypothetical protein DL89DRAFT_265543 [Linderina pennispora]
MCSASASVEGRTCNAAVSPGTTGHNSTSNRVYLDCGEWSRLHLLLADRCAVKQK